MSCETTRPVRIAVIGSGLAGLVTAYTLQTLKVKNASGQDVVFEVELFEKSDKLGMDSNSISVDLKDGTEPFRIDSPMRSINGGSHSHVFGLYKHLGIDLRRSDFSYSFSRLARRQSLSFSSRNPNQAFVLSRDPSPPPPYSQSDDSSMRIPTAASLLPAEKSIIPPPRPAQTTQFLYEGSNGLMFPPLAFPSAVSKAPIFAQVVYILDLLILALSYVHLLLLAFAYSWLGLTQLAPPRTFATIWAGRLGLRKWADQDVEQFCHRHWVSNRMKEEVLIPLYAAVSTTDREQARKMPVAECLNYIVSTFGSSHYVAEVGVQQVVERLIAPLPSSQVHLATTIESISLSPTSSQILVRLASSEQPLLFDHVIFATQANQASILLPTMPSLLPTLSALGSFEYVRTLVINHTDSSILPPLSRDHRDLNLVSFESARSPEERKRDRLDSGSKSTLGSSSIQATHILSRTHPRITGAGAKSTTTMTKKTTTTTTTTELYQTTNPIVEIDPEKILSLAWYERAIVSKKSKRFLNGFLIPDSIKSQSGPTRRSSAQLSRDGSHQGEGRYQGVENVWFVGSWCAEGIPLLEGCVTSSEKVVRQLVQRCGVDSEQQVQLQW